MSETRALLDNVVLSNFLLAEAEDVLIQLLGGRMWVTSEVLAENAAGRVAGHARLARVDSLLAAGNLLDISMTATERAAFIRLVPFLGRGEASCIAVARERDAVFASDDRVARDAAVARGVPVTGTIGLLVASVRRGAMPVDDADGVLGRMVEAGFYSPVRSIAGLV